MTTEIRTETAAQAMVDFARGLRFEDLPPEVVEKAKLHLLDSIGIALASTKLEFGRAIHETVRAWGGTPESTLIGFGGKVPAPSAALLNGSLIHGLDFDDTHLGAIIHVSTVVVAAALAVGEAHDVTGRELIAALVAGNEVDIRIGLAAPSEFHHRGFHPTPICGPFAAAIVTGRLSGHDRDAMTNAFGIAGSQAAGIQEFLRDGSSVKRFHPGWAAHGGVIAAQVAANGLTGPARVLEGHYGLYNVLLGPGRFHEEVLTDGLGERWETLNLSIKPYPCCHFGHAFIDSAKAIRHSTPEFRVDQIDRIVANISPTPGDVLYLPEDMKKRPPTPYAAMFSLPYMVALGLSGDRAGLPEFAADRIGDPALLAIAERVERTDDPLSRYPTYFSGYLEVHLKDGRVLSHREEFNRGSPANPLPREEIEAKFLANAALGFGDNRGERVIDAVRRLESLASVSELTALLS